MQKNKKSTAKKDTRQRAAPRKVKGASPGVKEKTDYGIKKDAVPGKEKAGAKKKGFRKRLYDMRLFFKEKSGFRQNTDNKECRMASETRKITCLWVGMRNRIRRMILKSPGMSGGKSKPAGG